MSVYGYSAPTGPVNTVDSCIFVAVLYFPVFFVSCIFLYFYFFTALLCIFVSFTHGTDYNTKSFSVCAERTGNILVIFLPNLFLSIDI